MSIGEQKSTPKATLFSKEQMELLQKLIDQKTSSSSPPASTSTRLVAQKGNFLMDLITQMEKQNPWIVDFNASHHMTSNATPFHNYNPSSGNFME